MENETTEKIEAQNPTLVDKGPNIYLELGRFKDKHRNKYFWYPQVKSTEGAIEHFNTVGREKNNGANVTVALINGRLQGITRARASTKLENGNEELISQQEAFDWSPGDRELTSVTSLYKAYKDEIEKATAKKELGDIVGAKEHVQKALALKKQHDDKKAEEELKNEKFQEELLASLS